MINLEKRRYLLTGLTPILGGQPASEAVRTQFMASKAPSPAAFGEEEEMLPDLDERGLTVFHRDPETDALCLLDYQMRGFFKAAINALEDQEGVKQAASKVDKFLFASPRRIPLMRDGQPIIDEDDQLERPLRAKTMQGDRVALAASERVMDPWSIEVELTLIPNKGTAKSKSLTWETIENALSYGVFSGLGQWRSGSNGRFSWERLEDKPKRGDRTLR